MDDSGSNVATEEVDFLAEIAKEPQNYANFYKFAALEITLSIWLIFYLFFSAKVLGATVSFLANWFFLKKPQELRIAALHFAWLRGMVCARDVTYSNKDGTTRAVDVVIVFRWWRDWAKSARNLLHVRVAGLEHSIVNNSHRYDKLHELHKQRRDEGLVEETLKIGLDAPPPPPWIFWLSRAITVDVHTGSILVGNALLKTMLATSFSRVEGEITLEEREPHMSRSVAELTFHDVSMKLKENKQCSDGEGDLSSRGALQIFGGFILSAFTSPFRTLSGEQHDTEGSADEVLSAPLVRVRSYQDAAGYIRTPDAGESIDVHPDEEVCESGAEVDVAHGKLTYGPWEERQRLQLQHCYAPESYQDTPLTQLVPGWLTVGSGVRVRVRLRGSATLRVPFPKEGGGRARTFRDYRSGLERNRECDGWIAVTVGQERAGVAAEEQGWRGGGAGREQRVAEEEAEAARGPRGEEEELRSMETRSREASEKGESSRSSSSSDTSSTWSADADSEVHGEESDDDDGSQAEEGEGRALAREGMESIAVVGELESFSPLWALREQKESSLALSLHGGVAVSTCIHSEATRGVVWSSSGVEVKATVRRGLKYGSAREMEVETSFADTTVRLLRDHTLLISALLADASWRPRNVKQRGAERHFFVPTANKVKVVLKDQYRFGLVVNEENVVDDYGDDRINNVLWLRGREAVATATSLPTVFKELQTRQLLTVELPKVTVDLHPRRTDDVFGTIPRCIKIDSLRITGDNNTSNRSQLAGSVRVMNACITATGVSAVSHGMVVRALRNVIRNYFGDCSISVTSKDFQTTRCDETCTTGWNFRKKMHSFRVAESATSFSPDGREATFHLDKSFRIALTDVNVELPEHLAVTVKRSQCASAQIREVLIELRSTKAFSDLVVNFSPIAVEFPQMKTTPSPQHAAAEAPAQGVLVVDGLDFYQHSYHGPEPLRETYRSFTKIQPGRLTGEIAPSQLYSLSLWAAQLWHAQSDWQATTAGDRKGGTPGKLWRRARAWQTLEAESGGISLVVPGPGCIGHFDVASCSIKSDNLINSEYHETTSIKAPGIQASLSLANMDPLGGGGTVLSGLPANATDLPVGLEVARVQSSLQISARHKYSGWEVDAVNQYNFLTEKDVTTRLGLELAEYQQVAGMDETSSEEEEDNAVKSPKEGQPDPSLSGEKYPTSLSLSGTDSGDFQSIGSGAETPKTETSVEADFVTADEQSSGMDEDFLSFDDSVSLPSPPPAPDLMNSAFPFISHQTLQRVLVPLGSKMVPLLSVVRRGHCTLDGLRILPTNWAPSRFMQSRPSTPTRKKRYGWNVPHTRSPIGHSGKFALRYVEIETQSLVIQMCPLAVDVLSKMAETIPHMTSTVEGCMDAIRQRQYRAPVSLAFQGNHQLKTTLTVRAAQIELQLLQPPQQQVATLGREDSAMPVSPPSPGPSHGDSESGSESGRSRGGRAGMRLFSVGVEGFEVQVQERREAKDWKSEQVLRGLRGRYDAAKSAGAGARSRVQSRDQSISVCISKFCSWLCALPQGPTAPEENFGLSKQLIEEKCRGSSMLPAVSTMHSVASVLAVVSGGKVQGRLVTSPPPAETSGPESGGFKSGVPSLYRLDSDVQSAQLPNRSCSIEADGVVLVCAPRCPEALGPVLHVWSQLGKQTQAQAATRGRVRLRNVELVLDQALPQIARGRGRSGSLGGGQSIWGENLPQLASLRRSKSEAPPEARRAGMTSGPAGIPSMRRYGSENASQLKQRVTLSQVVSFLRCCSKKDLLELDSCLRTPATCEFVSHRTMNNVVSGSQFGSNSSAKGWSLELAATVRGLRLTVEPSLASELLSEISSNYSSLAVVCTREVSKLGAILGSEAADPKITVVGQMWCGKWILKMFPSLVGFSSEVAAQFGRHGREQAQTILEDQRAAWPHDGSPRMTGKQKEHRSVSFALAEADEQPSVQSVSTVVPLQGVLKRVTLPHRQLNQRSADLNRQYLASLSAHGPLSWRSSHKRPRSLNSMAMLDAVVQGFELPSIPLAKENEAGHGDAGESGLAGISRTPISIHLQASMDASVNATVPAQGQMRFRIKDCTVSLTQTSFPQQQLLDSERAFKDFGWQDEPKQTMQTLSFKIVSLATQILPMHLQSEDGAIQDHPQLVASDISLSMIRSHSPPVGPHAKPFPASPLPSFERNRSDTMNNVKEAVQGSHHLYKGVVLDVDNVSVEASLPKLEWENLRNLLVPWMASTGHNLGGSARGDSVTSGSGSSTPILVIKEGTPYVLSVTVSIRQSKADLRVLNNVKVLWESERGLYATSCHYARPVRRHGLVGKELAQTEYCFRLSESSVVTIKQGPPDDKASKFQIPELRATGKMKTRLEEEGPITQPHLLPALSREAEVRGSARNLFAPSESSSIAPESMGSQSGPMDVSAEWKTPRSMARSLTDVSVVFYMREMTVDIGESLMDSLLDLQSAMGSEITMLLQDAERNAESIKQKFRKRSAKGVQFHFLTTFMLEGIRLRASAPSAALLLDSGSVVMQVEGRPKRSIPRRAQNLHWKIKLEGLSIAMTAPQQRPYGVAVPARPPATPTSSATPPPSSAGHEQQTQWILAHLRNNTEMLNTAGDSETNRSMDSETLNASSSAPTTFRLLLTKTEFVAHPGSIQCFEILYTHYEQLLAKYKTCRKQIETGQMDQVLNRVLLTTKKAMRGRIEKQAPTLMGNLFIQVVIQETRASLLFAPEIGDAYSFTQALNSNLADTLKRASIRNPQFRGKAPSLHDSKGKDSHGRSDITHERGLHASLSRIGLWMKSWKTTHTTASSSPAAKWQLRSHLDFQGLYMGFSPGTRRSHGSPADKGARWRMDVDSEDFGNDGLTGLRFEEAEAALQVVELDRYKASLQVTLPSFQFGLDSSSVECALLFHDMWFRGHHFDVIGRRTTPERAESGGSVYESANGSFQSLNASEFNSPVSASPRVISLEMSLSGAEGTFRLYPNAFEERKASDATIAMSRADRKDFVLLEVPFPVFNVNATAVVLFSWKGFRDSQVRWLDRSAGAKGRLATSSKVEVDGVVYDLDVALVCCVFEIPRDFLSPGETAMGGGGMPPDPSLPKARRGSSYLSRRPALTLSPAVLDFAREVVDIVHQHHVRVHTRSSSYSYTTPTHSQSAKGMIQTNGSHNSGSFYSPEVTTPKTFLSRSGGWRTASNGLLLAGSAGSDKTTPATSGPMRRGRFFILNDVMYSMSFSALDLKLSGKLDGNDAVGIAKESGQHLELSATSFDASWVVSSKQPSQITRNLAISLRKLELRLIEELTQTPREQMSFVLEDLVMSFIVQKTLQKLPKNSLLCVIKSIKADIDVEAAVHKSKLLQDWSHGIGRIGDTSQWSLKDKGLHARLHQGRKGVMLRGLVQVGDVRMILNTPVGKADLSAPYSAAKDTSSQRRRPALIACSDLNLPAISKEKFDRQMLEDTFSVSLASCRLRQEVGQRSQAHEIGLDGDGNISRAFVYSCVSRQQTGGWQAYVQKFDLRLQTMDMANRHLPLPFVDLHASTVLMSAHAKKGASLGSSSVASVSYESFAIQASSETIKTTRQLLRQLEATFEEDVDIGASPKMAFTAFTKTWSGDLDDDDGEAEDVVLMPLTLGQRGREESVAPVSGNFGQLKVNGVDLLVTIFHDDVHKEKDVVLSLKDLQLELERRQDNHDLRTNLLVSLRNAFLVQAGRKRKQAKLYFKLEGDHGSNIIFHVPQASVDIRTSQTVSQDGTMSPLVQCELETSFESPIFASQNRELYQFLEHHLHHLREAQNAEARARQSPDTRDYRCLLFKLEPTMALAPDCSMDIGWVLYQLGVTKPESILAAVNTGIIDRLQAVLVSVGTIVQYAPVRRAAPGPRQQPSLHVPEALDS